MATLNTDPSAVAKLLQAQQLQQFRENASEATREVAVTKARKAAKGNTAKSDTAKPASEYILLQSIVVSFPHSGPMRFQAGQRITDPYVLSQLKAVGADLEPVAG
jgi:preprotein translocase subunit SecD